MTTQDNSLSSIEALASEPEVRAFFNQQMSILKPYLIQQGVCGVKVGPSMHSPDKKKVVFYYEMNGEVLETSAESENIFEATIEARNDMQTGLNKIINALDDNGDLS